MSVSVPCSSTRITRVVCLLVITALVPVLALAGDPSSTARTPTIKTSAAQMVAREIAAAPTRPAPARAEQQTNGSTTSTSFFRTRPGMIALAVMVAGTGYAIYSAHNDRIHSPGRQ